MIASTTTTRDYAVEGMTCSHCARSVAEELEATPGVERVEVDRPAGRVTIAGAGVGDDAIAAAVARAGYRLAAAP